MFRMTISSCPHWADYVIGLAMDRERADQQWEWVRERDALPNWQLRQCWQEVYALRLKRPVAEKCILTWAQLPRSGTKDKQISHLCLCADEEEPEQSRRNKGQQQQQWQLEWSVCSVLFCSSPVLQLRMRACNLQLPMPLSPSLSLSLHLWGDTCQSHSSIFSR